MAKTSKNLGLMLATLILILACATPATPPPPGFAETAIAGTYSVAASQTAKVQVQQDSVESLTPTATRIPSASPLPTFTLVVFGEPEVRALVNASCREGPGNIYDQVFLLRVGRVTGLVGKSADGFYLIIRNPNNPEQLCWVETFKVQIIGIAVSLPVMTPPPTPRPTRTPTRTRRPAPTVTLTPTITATSIVPVATNTEVPTPLIDLFYSGLDDCPTTSQWWVNFEVGNTGDVNFESISLNLTDNNTSTDFTLVSEQFTSSNGCGAPDSVDTLVVGTAHVVSSLALNYDPSNPSHNFDATVTLCTLPALGGDCVTKTMNVTP